MGAAAELAGAVAGFAGALEGVADAVAGVEGASAAVSDGAAADAGTGVLPDAASRVPGKGVTGSVRVCTVAGSSRNFM